MKYYLAGIIFVFLTMHTLGQEGNDSRLQEAERLQQANLHQQAYKLLSSLLKGNPESERMIADKPGHGYLPRTRTPATKQL